jgi:hypothetical protein
MSTDVVCNISSTAIPPSNIILSTILSSGGTKKYRARSVVISNSNRMSGHKFVHRQGGESRNTAVFGKLISIQIFHRMSFIFDVRIIPAMHHTQIDSPTISAI